MAAFPNFNSDAGLKKLDEHLLSRSYIICYITRFVNLPQCARYESDHLRYVWFNQKKLRSNTYEAIRQASLKGGVNMSRQRRRVQIPASFIGGPRYMNQHYLDAMCIVRHLGYPDLFITFTCNPKWPEITRYLQQRNLTTEDRPDIMCRVFKMKLDNLMLELGKPKRFYAWEGCRT